ncbi:MAG: hypothetical protein QXM12_07610 [Nitrososphaerota archaeon]
MVFLGKRALILAAVVAFTAGCFSVGWAGVSIRVSEDVYVLPVAELATTKTHPEIVKLENDLIEVTLIPNRGRILSSYSLKDKKEKPESFLYRNFVPKPMVLPDGLHVVEFGGYYLSLPWNDRDRQPFDLSFTLNQRNDLAEVFLSGRDMLRRTLTECWVRIRDRSPIVEIEVKITNLSKKELRNAAFKDFTVLDASDGCFLVLPVRVVKVVESRNNWLGESDTLLNWPATFASWSSIKDYVRFVAKDLPLLPGMALIYPDQSIAFVKWWEPEEIFSGFEVWSWGQSWVNEPGADAYIVVSNVLDNLTLKPQEGISFKVYFTALKNASRDTSLQELLNRSKNIPASN